MDSASFVGSIIEIECGENKIYMGSVLEIDTKLQEISLCKVSLNGMPLDVSNVRIRGEDVKNLAIISDSTKETKIPSRTPAEQKPRVKETTDKKEQTYLDSSELQLQNKKYQQRNEKGNKKQKAANQALAGETETYTTDFDFERNLALFDKKAVFNELKDNIMQGIAKSVVRNYKGNENILESEPVSFRQITIPLEHVGKEYTTDSGFIIPAISSELRRELFTRAENAGLSVTQRIENAGICTCKMALQLVGGERRICPKNSHQAPEIIVLAGANLDGLQAICAARHLANHTAKVMLFVPEVDSLLQSQVELFQKTNGIVIKTVEELPSQPVDLVIDAFSNNGKSEVQHQLLSLVIDWANHNKAPVLALDPCIRSPRPVNIVIKWSLSLALPLIASSKCGRLYLADIGIPCGVFKDVGISYKSPFGDKFVIPLHD